MKTLLSTLALTAALTSAALADEPTAPTGAARPGPVVLTEAQLDTVTAGAGQSGGINGGGEFITRYGGGAGVDPSVYGGAAGGGVDG